MTVKTLLGSHYIQPKTQPLFVRLQEFVKLTGIVNVLTVQIAVCPLRLLQVLLEMKHDAQLNLAVTPQAPPLTATHILLLMIIMMI